MTSLLDLRHSENYKCRWEYARANIFTVIDFWGSARKCCLLHAILKTAALTFSFYFFLFYSFTVSCHSLGLSRLARKPFRNMSKLPRSMLALFKQSVRRKTHHSTCTKVDFVAEGYCDIICTRTCTSLNLANKCISFHTNIYFYKSVFRWWKGKLTFELF